MGKCLFTIIIIVLAGLAILFQAIGLGVTAWKKFHLSGNANQIQSFVKSFSTSFGGLDSLNGQNGGLDQRHSIIQRLEGNQYVIVDLTTEKYMCLVGILAAIAGTVLLVIFVVSPVDKPIMPMQVVVFCCVAAWVVSAVLGFIAVGLGAKNENKLLEMVAKMAKLFSQSGGHFLCPWAIVMTGIGAFFALVVGIVVILRALQLTDNTKLPGTWSRFKNFAV